VAQDLQPAALWEEWGPILCSWLSKVQPMYFAIGQGGSLWLVLCCGSLSLLPSKAVLFVKSEQLCRVLCFSALRVIFIADTRVSAHLGLSHG
jgi:hypothetical protein